MVIEGGGSGAGDKQSSSDEKRSSTQPQQQQQQPSQPQLPQQQSTITVAATTQSTQSTVTLGDQTHSQPQPPISSSASAVQQQHHTSNPTGHQVIAVSASKGPAAFFNLARKFLATDEFCDLSALEGAIVSAVDAAHLLERSKLADIVRIQTSYVPVEPKRKSQQHQQQSDSSKEPGISTAAVGPAAAAPSELQREGQASTSRKTHLGKKGAPLRRSRIIITVKRTNDYKQWLEENPYHASGHNDDIEHSPT